MTCLVVLITSTAKHLVRIERGGREKNEVKRSAVVKTRIELPGQRVLDMCAGPGGKTLAMLQTMRRIFSVLDKFVGKGEGVGSVRNTVEVEEGWDTYE